MVTVPPPPLLRALIRPGRFDSQINIPLPDVRARFQILKVHAKKVTVSDGEAYIMCV